MNQNDIDRKSIEKAKELFTSGKVYEMKLKRPSACRLYIKHCSKDFILFPERFAS